MAYKSGRTGRGMRESGEGIKLTGKGNSGMLTEMCSMENGKTIRRMGTECTPTRMGRSTKATGKTTFKMGGESRHGRMARSTKVTTKKERSTGTGHTLGMMGLVM